MIDLNDIEQIEKFDKSSQLKIMSSWSNLVKEARTNSLSFTLPSSYQWRDKVIQYQSPTNVLICGMGGSAIAGDYLVQAFENELNIPVIVNKTYNLPNFVDEHTLVVCISYSGNTEETLARFHEALEKKTMIVSISSGGLLEKFSQTVKTPHIEVKAGLPPRSSFPLIYISLISIFEKFGLISGIEDQIKEAEEVLIELASSYSPLTVIENNSAKKIAYELFNTLPITIGHTIFSPVAYRSKCEFNENSKIIALSEVLPEQNHNGIVVWDNSNKALNHVSVLFIRDRDEPKPIKIRVEETKKLISSRTEKVLEVFPKGKTILAKQLSTTYLIDFISIYLAILNEIDPTITTSINNLKKVLKRKLNLRGKFEDKITKG